MDLELIYISIQSPPPVNLIRISCEQYSASMWSVVLKTIKISQFFVILPFTVITTANLLLYVFFSKDWFYFPSLQHKLSCFARVFQLDLCHNFMTLCRTKKNIVWSKIDTSGLWFSWSCRGVPAPTSNSNQNVIFFIRMGQWLLLNTQYCQIIQTGFDKMLISICSPMKQIEHTKIILQYN